MTLPKIVVLYLAASALPAIAFAQPQARPDPADPKISVPPAVYVSPMKQYQPLGNAPVAPWRAANDTVEKIGGWKVYAREASDPGSVVERPAQPLQPPVPQMKPPAQGGHSGHKMK